MIDSKKLLYILPDVCYVAELLPTKKEHTFSIHSFRQINGEFMSEDDDISTENIDKLFSKLESESYHLVLPDFLFTNTIINVSASSDSKINSYLSESLLPSLNLESSSHYVDSNKLTEFKGTAKVQLSAIEKEVLTPIQQAAAEHSVEISAVSPLSWTLKAVVSLEPSITVAQIGSKLYTAFHYIGVDQTTIAEVDDTDAVVETIKTLKGAEPSIQTIYLLSNSLIEEELKEKLSNVLPIQQLATFKEEESQMPSYVKHIIENGMKTLSISDFPVPQFELDATATTATPKVSSTTEAEEADTDAVPVPTAPAPEPSMNDLPKPKPPVAETPDTEAEETEELDEEENEQATEKVDEKTASKTAKSDSEDSDDSDSDAEDDDAPDEDLSSEDAASLAQLAGAGAAVSAATTNPTETKQPEPAAKTAAPAKKDDDEVDISQFVEAGSAAVATTTKKKTEVIKNKPGATNMFKMIFVIVSVFFLTVAIGVGVGYMVLQWSTSDEPQSPQVEEAADEVTPSPTPAEEASDSADLADASAVDPEELSILVVNATTKAGYAGTTKDKLDDAEVGTTAAANAKGDYEPGYYVLMAEEDADLMAFLTETTELDLEFSDEIETEDAAGTYDAVIVLAE